jgi:hypothetical protein
MRDRTTKTSPPAYLTPEVYGLDAARAQAHRAQRSRRLRSRMSTALFTIVAIAGFATIAWVGYQVYLDHTRAAEIEHQQGVEEMNRKHEGESMDDVINNLEDTPEFNGPGAPALGLGPDTTQP